MTNETKSEKYSQSACAVLLLVPLFFRLLSIDLSKYQKKKVISLEPDICKGLGIKVSLKSNTFNYAPFSLVSSIKLFFYVLDNNLLLEVMIFDDSPYQIHNFNPELLGHIKVNSLQFGGGHCNDDVISKSSTYLSCPRRTKFTLKRN
jgi:hypothetical protein